MTKGKSRSRSPTAMDASVNPAFAQTVNPESARKPLTSDLQGKMNLSGAFPEKPKLSDEPNFLIDDLQAKIKEL